MVVKKTFCTTREAASLLGVSLSTAQNWVESGLLDAWKTDGGHRRISRASVNKLLADSEARRSILGTRIEAAGGGERLRILVAEDDLTLLRIYQIRLSVWPMSPVVETARDGFEALVKIGLKLPDLLISDLQMPHIDGFQMVRSLRAMPNCAAMKMVVVTGLGDGDIAAAGGVPDGVEVFPKPIPFARLEAIAQRIFENKVQARDHAIAD